MKGTSFYLISLLFIISSFPGIAQKTVKRQPACLLDAGKEVRIDQLISEQCPPDKKKTVAWSVYSNRGADFGKKYYVVDENQTQFSIYSGSGVYGLTILNSHEVGWKPKSHYLFHFSADFTPEALIHRKCVVLNSQGLVDSICNGIIEESRIPVYHSPTDMVSKEFLPLYSIYFIYQTENKRYLLGKDYSFDPNSPFSSQIIGWVDANRVFDYDSRLCFEPNFQSGSVQKRRCDTIYGNSKVFSTVNELGVFLANRKVNIEPLWEEPDSFYLAPSIVADLKNGKIKVETVRNSICTNCKTGSDCFDSFTNKERSSEFFRFPFLGGNKSDRKIFQVAATGKYVRSKQSICDSLSRNKNKLRVFFIIPDSLPNSYAVFFLNQLHTKYTNFTKKYDACYFPRPANRFLLVGNTDPNQNRYNILLDSLINHKPNADNPGDKNCFTVLNQVLDKEPFLSQETNLIVLINTSKTTFEPNDSYAPISAKLAEKNCYLLTFDLSDNPSFTSTVDVIMRKAIDVFRENHGLNPIPINWHQIGKCRMITNYLLATAWSIDTTGLKGPQILEYIQASYDPVISTIAQVINAECSAKSDTIGLTPNESAFRQGLEKLVPGCGKNINSMRILQKGYTRLQYQDTKNPKDNIWQAEVLMTEDELDDLTTAIDGLTIDLTSSNICDRVCDLWQILIRRFIGENMILNNAYLEFTIPQILDKIIGASFDYPDTEKIKKFSIRQICECQDDVNEPSIEYQDKLSKKNNALKAILNQKPFKIERENGKTTDINYYWVPIFLLP